VKPFLLTFSFLTLFAAAAAAQEAESVASRLVASTALIQPRFGPPVRRAFSATAPSLSEAEAEALEAAMEGVHLPAPPVPSEGNGSAAPSTSASAPPVRAARGAVVATPDAFRFFNNSAVGNDGAPLTFKSLVASPRVAVNDNIVFQTGNWYAAWSTDELLLRPGGRL
jgi:hypothetical protein